MPFSISLGFTEKSQDIINRQSKIVKRQLGGCVKEGLAPHINVVEGLSIERAQEIISDYRSYHHGPKQNQILKCNGIIIIVQNNITIIAARWKNTFGTRLLRRIATGKTMSDAEPNEEKQGYEWICKTTLAIYNQNDDTLDMNKMRMIKQYLDICWADKILLVEYGKNKKQIIREEFRL